MATLWLCSDCAGRQTSSCMLVGGECVQDCNVEQFEVQIVQSSVDCASIPAQGMNQ